MGNISTHEEVNSSTTNVLNFIETSKNYRKLFETATELPRLKSENTEDHALVLNDVSNLKPATLPTVFRWKKGGNTIFLMGSFDEWSQRYQLVPTDNEFMVIIDLPYGRHQYKFIVDNVFTHDPDEPVIDSGQNSFNNYILIQKSDSEIFKALSVDEIHTYNDDAEAFAQEIPQRTAGIYYQRPPTVPPQLLQIVLNKDPPIRAEPTFLFTPSCAEINHLHAQSMKEGMVTLSATYRYKKKFTTTIMYSPI